MHGERGWGNKPQPRRKQFKDSFFQNYNLTSRHPPLLGQNYSILDSLTASCVRVEDTPALALRKQDQSESNLLRGLLE